MARTWPFSELKGLGFVVDNMKRTKTAASRELDTRHRFDVSLQTKVLRQLESVCVMYASFTGEDEGIIDMTSSMKEVKLKSWCGITSLLELQSESE
eukprot:scaffold7615_cov86-Skeletonema_dohrnii-CCMP3373.AAC.4